MKYLGDFAVNTTVRFMWNAFAVAGQSITRAVNGSIRIYKNNSTTQRTSAAGITDSEDFDGLTGLMHVNIDLSNNTDAGFYVTGADYMVVIEGTTIDGKVINAVIGEFSIENRSMQNRIPAALVGGRIDASVGAMAAAVLTATAIAADAITAAKIAPDAIGASELAADAVAEIQSGLATAVGLAMVLADTDDIQTRLPASLSGGRMRSQVEALDANAITAASIAADAIGASELAADAVAEIQSGLATAAALATVQADTDDIQTRLPAALVAGRMDSNLSAIDGIATAGNLATLNLKQLNIVNPAGDAVVASSTGGGGTGINASGNGAGEGIKATGGATGNGIEAVGGATSGNAIRATATAGDSNAIEAIGIGLGAGARIKGGATGNGIKAEGGITAGDGILAQSPTNGHGIEAIGGTNAGDGINGQAPNNGHGIAGIGGPIAGNGINAKSQLAPSAGFKAEGVGTGPGIHAVGGAGGSGLLAQGGSAGGSGITAEAQAGVGHGIDAEGGPGGGNGIKAKANAGDGVGLLAQGQGGGAGIESDGGATGSGLLTIGGATSGPGINAQAGGAGQGAEFTGFGGGTGMLVVGDGGGQGFYAQAGTTGVGFLANGGATNGDGFKAVGGGGGKGINAIGGANGSGIQATGGGTSGDGINASASGDGHGLILQANGDDKHGLLATGAGGAGVNDGIKGVAGAGGVSIRDVSNKLGGFTGSGTNTVLGFLRAIARGDLAAPSDMGGTYDPAIAALETISDDAANNVLAIATAIGALNDISTADVLTQVNTGLDAAGVELSVIPGVAPSLRVITQLLYQALRNETTATATQRKIRKDDGTVIGTAPMSDDTVTFNKGKYV
jgi:hypothetical protein